MKKLLIAPLLLVLSFANAQLPGYTVVAGKWSYKDFEIRNTATLPRDTVTGAADGSLAVKNGTLYIHITFWQQVATGSSTPTWGNITGNLPDQIDLSNALNGKLGKIDTATMLSAYLRSALGVKIVDTAAMLSPYLRSSLFTKTNIGLGNVINSLQVVNAGNFTSAAIMPFASLPAPSGGPTMVFASDTLAWYYNTGSSYVKMAGGGGAGGGGADSALFATKWYTDTSKYPLHANPAGYLIGITGSMVNSALGYTAYSSANPSGFITGNQSISFAATGDATGTASGSTSLSVALVVNKIKGATVPTLAIGNLKYNGSAFVFDSATYLPMVWNSNLNITGNNKTVSIFGGNLNLTSSASNGTIGIGNGIISISGSSNFPTQQFSVSTTFNLPAVSMQYFNGTSTIEAIRIVNDTVNFFGPLSVAGSSKYSFLRNGTSFFPGSITGVTESNSDSSNKQASTALLHRLLSTFNPGAANRVGPLDSLSRVSQGAQIIGSTLLMQTANGSFAGLESTAHFKEMDSIIQRLFKTNLAHTGSSGVWSAYGSPLGDTLYFKNITNNGGGISIVTLPDSSVGIGIDYSYVASLSTTQTLSNKTLTAPLLTSPQLETSSTVGYAWIATDASGHGHWAASSNTPNLTPAFTSTQFSITAGGSAAVIPGATHLAAGAITAASQSRIDSLVWVTNSGHGHPLLRAPSSRDTLMALGVDMVNSSDIAFSYLGNLKDSVAFSAAIRVLTTNGDLFVYNSGNTRLPVGAEGSILKVVSGMPTWQIVSGTGTVTNVTSNTTAGTLFNIGLTNNTTTPAFAFSLQNAPAAGVFGSVAGGTPAYFTPVLASALFSGQGGATQVLHGGGTGNPVWGPFNYATDGTGTIQATNFPALTGGDVSNTVGTLAVTINSGAVTNTKIANGTIDLTSKVTNLLPGANGGTGVANTGKTITIGGNLSFTGGFTTNFNVSSNTSLNLPSTGTVLITTGSGSALSGITWDVTGTPNQVLVNNLTGLAQTGHITLTTPQDIGTTSSPTFTGLTLNGASINFTNLATGSFTDNLVTIDGTGRLRKYTSVVPQAGGYTPTQYSGNIATLRTSQVMRIGSTVSVDGQITMNPATGSNTVELSVPFDLSSPFQFAEEVNGFVSEISSNASVIVGSCTADISDARTTGSVKLSFNSPNTNGRSFFYHYVYILH